MWLINAHNGIKGKLERIHIEDYPALKAHLDQFKHKLEERSDKGDTPYNLRNCAYMHLFFQPKICWKAVGRLLSFALVESGTFLTAPASFISAGVNNEYILACLCSEIGKYFIFKNSDTTGAGDIMLNIQSLVKLPIPLDFDRRYVSKILKSPDREELVNLYVKQLYGFSQEEWDYIKDFQR